MEVNDTSNNCNPAQDEDENGINMRIREEMTGYCLLLSLRLRTGK